MFMTVSLKTHTCLSSSRLDRAFFPVKKSYSALFKKASVSMLKDMSIFPLSEFAFCSSKV